MQLYFKKLWEKFSQFQLEVWFISNYHNLCAKIYFGTSSEPKYRLSIYCSHNIFVIYHALYISKLGGIENHQFVRKPPIIPFLSYGIDFICMFTFH